MMNKCNKILLGSALMLMQSACFALAPIILKVINNTGVDVQAHVIKSEHIAEKDITTVEKYPIYGGRTIEFVINRTESPATIGIHFSAALGTGEVSGYSVGRWEYIESTPRYPLDAAIANRYNYAVDSCHDYAAETPFAISCLGSDSYPNPGATVTIDNMPPG